MINNALIQRTLDAYYKDYPLKDKNNLKNNDSFIAIYNTNNEKYDYSIEELQLLVDKIINWYECNCLNNSLSNIDSEIPYKLTFNNLKDSLPLKLSRILDVNIESYELSNLSKKVLSVIPYGLIHSSNSVNDCKSQGLHRAYLFYKDINKEYGHVFHFDVGDIESIEDINPNIKKMYEYMFLKEYFNSCKSIKNGYKTFHKRKKQPNKLISKIFNR